MPRLQVKLLGGFDARQLVQRALECHLRRQLCAGQVYQFRLMGLSLIQPPLRPDSIPAHDADSTVRRHVADAGRT